MYYEVPKNTQVPYVWEDITQDVKKLKVTVGGGSRTYNLDKIKIYKSIIGERGGGKYTVQLKAKGYTRCLEVKQKEEKSDLLQPGKLAASKYLQMMLIKRQFQRNEMNLTVRVHGLGFSFVDNEPKELLYVSLYKLTLKMTSWKEDPDNVKLPDREESMVGESNIPSREQSIKEDSRVSLGGGELERGLLEPVSDEKDAEEIFTKVDLMIQHLQVDDLVTDKFPVIFSPEKPLRKTPFEEMKEEDEGEEETKEGKDDKTPFI